MERHCLLWLVAMETMNLFLNSLGSVICEDYIEKDIFIIFSAFILVSFLYITMDYLVLYYNTTFGTDVCTYAS